MLKYCLQCIGCIIRFRNNLHVWLIFQKPPQSLPQQHMVMRQNTPDCSIFLDLCVGGVHRSSFLGQRSWDAAPSRTIHEIRL